MYISLRQINYVQSSQLRIQLREALAAFPDCRLDLGQLVAEQVGAASNNQLQTRPGKLEVQTCLTNISTVCMVYVLVQFNHTLQCTLQYSTVQYCTIYSHTKTKGLLMTR